MQSIKLWLAALALSAAALDAPAAARAAEEPTPHLSVLTYNVKGLPWPIAGGRPEALAQITARLRALRAAGKQPHVVVLQEAFTDAAKRIGPGAGYRYIVNGPSALQRVNQAMTVSDRVFAGQASWLKGERTDKLIDSGLQILSDYPVTSVRRAAFPGFACAGYDCLANKGVLLVTIDVPGVPTPVAIATAHLNSHRASGVSDARSLYAYRRQVDFLGSFFAAHRDPAIPLVFAGDFNVGNAAGRRAALLPSVGGWWSGNPHTFSDGLRACLTRIARTSPGFADVRYTVARARDWQFMFSGRLLALTAAAVSVPFGRDPAGSMLSDHVGYTIDYELRRRL